HRAGPLGPAPATATCCAVSSAGSSPRMTLADWAAPVAAIGRLHAAPQTPLLGCDVLLPRITAPCEDVSAGDLLRGVSPCRLAWGHRRARATARGGHEDTVPKG